MISPKAAISRGIAWLVVLLCSTHAAAEISGPSKVIDGDTIKVGSVKVRLYGVDAPELAQTCWDSDRELPCGRIAQHKLWENLRGRVVVCEERGKDRYKRVIALCRDETGRDIVQNLVLEGWILAYHRYSDHYADEEHQAREARRGLWAWKFTRPCKWRKMASEFWKTPEDCK